MRTATWYADSGDVVQFGDAPPYLLRALDDSLGASAEVVRAPRQDGVTTYYTALDNHTVNLTGHLVAYGSRTLPAQTVLDRRRAALCSAFAPHRFGTLIYHTEDGNRQIRCRPIAAPTFGRRVQNTCTVDIEFVSDSPYWESAELYTLLVGSATKRWTFPMALPPRGFVFGSFLPKADIHNPTAELIYPTLEVTSTAQRVTVSNETTGKAVRISRAIAEGQKMVIHMQDASALLFERDDAAQWVESEDVSHWLTLDSDPWGLVPGDNTVAITGGTAQDTPVTYIQYRVPYLGV